MCWASLYVVSLTMLDSAIWPCEFLFFGDLGFLGFSFSALRKAQSRGFLCLLASGFGLVKLRSEKFVTWPWFVGYWSFWAQYYCQFGIWWSWSEQLGLCGVFCWDLSWNVPVNWVKKSCHMNFLVAYWCTWVWVGKIKCGWGWNRLCFAAKPVSVEDLGEGWVGLFLVLFMNFLLSSVYTNHIYFLAKCLVGRWWWRWFWGVHSDLEVGFGGQRESSMVFLGGKEVQEEGFFQFFGCQVWGI